MNDEVDGAQHHEVSSPRRRVTVIAGACVAIVAAIVIVSVARSGDDERSDTGDVSSPIDSTDTATEPTSSINGPEEPTSSPQPDDAATASTVRRSTIAPPPSSSTGSARPTPPAEVPATSPAATTQTTLDAPVESAGAPADPVEPPDVDAATAAIDELLATTVGAIDDESPDTSEPVPAFDEVAIGAVRAEMEATIAEFAELGWTQLGSPTIVDLRVVTPPSEDAPGDAVIEVCIDSTDVRIVDSAGNEVRRSGPSRSLNIYVLRLVGDRWVPAEHTFPDDADC